MLFLVNEIENALADFTAGHDAIRLSRPLTVKALGKETFHGLTLLRPLPQHE